ncbi:MAG: ATP-binding cassette domain-containing protein [Lachnospiraceae bacterium]|nr:ATP-binding cassette domain-containing protein [Lachnospiraceae bacterium]
MSEAILEMHNITKSFGKVVANKDVNLSLYPGEIHALLGENGAGKSTLMNILTGIYKPNSGSIYYNGKKVSIKSPRHAVDMGIGMVHQHFHLIPTLSVAENVFLYTSKCGLVLKKGEMEQKVKECSQQYQLQVDPAAKVWQLSVGEQQRVEIIKLLYRGADILILDEPSAVLTAQEAKDMFKVLRTMAEAGKCVIIISHKMQEVMQFADRVTVLKGGCVEDTMLAEEATIERMTKAIIGDREQKQEKNDGTARQQEEVLQVSNLSVKNDKGLEAVRAMSLS